LEKGNLMNKRMQRLLLLFIAFITIGCDQGTKLLAAKTLANAPAQSFLGGSFRLVYAENTGAFLGVGGNLPNLLRNTILVFGTGLILVLLLFFLVRTHLTNIQRFSLTLFFAGGASNLIDRIYRGSVIDFMNVGIGGLRTGIFNVADLAIMLGMALLIVAHFQPRQTALRS
jgi:signal peptidase II